MTPYGPRKVLRSCRRPREGQQVAGRTIRWCSWRNRQKTAVINDQLPQHVAYPRRELIGRLSAGRCELCEHTGEVQVHHVRVLAELDASDPTPWAKAMIRDGAARPWWSAPTVTTESTGHDPPTVFTT